jgi:DNA polymerase-3 subunit epsilon
MTTWGRLGVFDLETTGVDVDSSRIVSACIAVLDSDGLVVDRWDWLADPGIEIPDGAAAVHGITTERARAEGRPAVQVVTEIAQTLRVLFGLGMPVVVYNAPYDLSLLDRECRRHQLTPIDDPSPVLDPLVIDKAVDRFRKGKRTLEVTAGLYGVALDDAHDAGADAIAAGRVAQAILAAHPDELALPIEELHERQREWYAEQAASFQSYIRSVKGDESYVADTSWPLRPSEHPLSLLDTQPIPAPIPRGLVATAAPSRLELAAGGETARAVAPAPSRKPAVLRVAAAIITDADGRTLLVRKAGSSAFMQAGGKIEPGESALEALARELREEVSLDLDPDFTEYLGSFRAVAANEPDTVIRAEVFALVAQTQPVPAGEIAELVWIDDPSGHGLTLAALTQDTILPLWMQRRSALF